MRFAYADPPYPGQAYKYREHPDYGGEVDHGALIDRLERDYPDGWALSTNALSLQEVLNLCPKGVRVACWWNTNSKPPGGAGGWWWSWEPVIVCGGRRGGVPVRNVLMCGTHAAGRFEGGKPPAFCRWMFALLGALSGDQLDDLFPGSGAVSAAWRDYAAHPWLEPPGRRPDRRPEHVRMGEIHDELFST